ncbi:protein of unknown function-containing protein [Forsythia ovata]|uniref:Protein ENHANCED DISEASE RESISTANCE 2 C-terminal domain-containing protein n=1 Tax=Forsythia ovata TaxID=205694 RepID=A0ABD1TSG6_9LAMI
MKALNAQEFKKDFHQCTAFRASRAPGERSTLARALREDILSPRLHLMWQSKNRNNIKDQVQDSSVPDPAGRITEEQVQAQQSPPQFLRLALGCVIVVAVDMGFLVEAQSEEELSEKFFSAVKICQMEITSTTFVDNAMP